MQNDNDTPDDNTLTGLSANGKDPFIQGLFAEAEVDLSINHMEATDFQQQVARKVKLSAWQTEAKKKIIIKAGWKPLAALIAATVLQYLANPLLAILEAPLIVLEPSLFSIALAPLNTGAFIAAISLLMLRRFVHKLGLFAR